MSFSFSIQCRWHRLCSLFFCFLLCRSFCTSVQQAFPSLYFCLSIFTNPTIPRYIFSIWLFHTGLQSTSPGYRLQLLERSDMAQTLLLSMAVLEEQPDIRLQLLQTLQILSCASGLQAWVIPGSSGKVEGGEPVSQVNLAVRQLLHY